MKKILVSMIVAALACASFLTVGLVASANELSDANLGRIDVTADANVTDVNGTSVADIGNAESARRIMGKGDSFCVSATFGPSELNRYAYLRVEAEGDRVIEISVDRGSTWATVGGRSMEGIYGATVRGEDHRAVDDSQVTFYDISDFVPVATGAEVKIRFATPADAARDGCIFANFKIFRAPTFDFSDGQMTENADVKDEAQFFDFHRAKIENEGPKADGWGFYAWRILVPAGATDAHLVANLGFANRSISIIREDGTAETQIGWLEHENGKEGALLKTNVNTEWNEGILHYSLRDFLNADGTATPLIIKMRPRNLGQDNGPMTKSIQFSYTTEKNTVTPMPNAGIEDVVNVYEIKKDDAESPYMVSDNGVGNAPENNTYYDNDAQGIYRLPYGVGLERAVLRARVRGYYRLSVSPDQTTWTDVAIGDLNTADGNGPAQSDVFFDVTDYIDAAAAGALYVRIADNTTMNGFGPKWELLGLDCDYGDRILTFGQSDTIDVDISDDDAIQDRWGAAYVSDGKHRFADGSYSFTYHVRVPANTTDFYMRAKIGGANRKVEVSTDGGAQWTPIDDAKRDAAADIIKSDGAYYDLSAYLVSAGDTDISVRFGCNDAGSGADLNALTFVKDQDFSELVTGGATVEIASGTKETAVHVKDESLMWQLNGTASEPSGFGGGWHRFADTTSYFTYKVRFPADAKQNVYLKADVQGSNRHIEVSANGSVWTDLSYVGIRNGDPLYGADLLDGRFSYFKLDDYLTGGDTLYVKFSAKNEGAGNGADVYSNLYFLIGAEIVNGKGVLEADRNMVQNVNLSDATLLHEDDGSKFGREGDDIYRAASNANSFVYRFRFPEKTEFAYTMIRMKDTKDRYIEISSDGTTFKPLSYKGMDDVDGASYRNGNRWYFSLDQALRNSESKEVWLRFGAKDGGSDGIVLNEMIVFYNKPFDDAAAYPANPVVEEQTMIAGGGEDGFYQPELSVGAHDGNFDGDGFRFYDNATYGVYRFTYTGDPSVLKLVTEVRGGYRVSVSVDGKDWTDILISGIDYARESAPLQNRAYFDFNLTEFLNADKTLYVKVGDSTEWHGWGGAVSRITLLAVSGGGQTVRHPIFGEGELSKRVDLQDGAIVEAESGSTFEYTGRGVKGSDAYFTYKFALPADATSFFLALNHKNPLKVEVSSDGTAFAKVPDSAILNSEFGKGSAVTYDLAYCLETSKTVYVRFSDGNAADDVAAILLSMYAGYNTVSSSAVGKYYATEKHDAFIVGTQEESEHIHVMDTANVENRWEYRSIKKNANVIYKFSYDEGQTALKLMASVGGTFKISVSKDGVHFTDRLISTSQFYAQSGREEDCFYATASEYLIDISEFMRDNAAREIYVKVSDPVDDNDFGAQLVGLGLIGMSGDEVDPPAVGEAPARGGSCNSSIFGTGSMICGLILFAFGAALCIVKSKRGKSE